MPECVCSDPGHDSEGVEVNSTEFWVMIGTTAALLLVCGITSALNVAIMSLDATHLQVLKRSSDGKVVSQVQRAEGILKRHHVVLLSLTLLHAVADEALPVLTSRLTSNEYLGIAVAVPLVLLFGELVPSAIVSGRGLWFTSFFAPLTWAMTAIAFVVSAPIAALAARWEGHDSKHETRNYRRDQLTAFLRLHVHSGHNHDNDATEGTRRSSAVGSDGIGSDYEGMERGGGHDHDEGVGHRTGARGGWMAALFGAQQAHRIRSNQRSGTAASINGGHDDNSHGDRRQRNFSVDDDGVHGRTLHTASSASEMIVIHHASTLAAAAGAKRKSQKDRAQSVLVEIDGIADDDEDAYEAAYLLKLNDNGHKRTVPAPPVPVAAMSITMTAEQAARVPLLLSDTSSGMDSGGSYSDGAGPLDVSTAASRIDVHKTRRDSGAGLARGDRSTSSYQPPSIHSLETSNQLSSPGVSSVTAVTMQRSGDKQRQEIELSPRLSSKGHPTASISVPGLNFEVEAGTAAAGHAAAESMSAVGQLPVISSVDSDTPAGAADTTPDADSATSTPMLADASLRLIASADADRTPASTNRTLFAAELGFDLAEALADSTNAQAAILASSGDISTLANATSSTALVTGMNDSSDDAHRRSEPIGAVPGNAAAAAGAQSSSAASAWFPFRLSRGRQSKASANGGRHDDSSATPDTSRSRTASFADNNGIRGSHKRASADGSGPAAHGKQGATRRNDDNIDSQAADGHHHHQQHGSGHGARNTSRAHGHHGATDGSDSESNPGGGGSRGNGGTGLTEHEIRVIEGTLSLATRPISTRMVPAHKVFGLSTDAVLDAKLLRVIAESAHSRIPVYEGSNPRALVGLLLVKLLLRLDIPRHDDEDDDDRAPDRKRAASGIFSIGEDNHGGSDVEGAGATPASTHPSARKQTQHFTGIRVGDLPLIRPIVLHPSTTMLEALRRFEKAHSHMAVITKDIDVAETALKVGRPLPVAAPDHDAKSDLINDQHSLQSDNQNCNHGDDGGDTVDLLGILTLEDCLLEVLNVQAGPHAQTKHRPDKHQDDHQHGGQNVHEPRLLSPTKTASLHGDMQPADHSSGSGSATDASIAVTMASPAPLARVTSSQSQHPRSPIAPSDHPQFEHKHIVDGHHAEPIGSHAHDHHRHASWQVDVHADHPVAGTVASSGAKSGFSVGGHPQAPSLPPRQPGSSGSAAGLTHVMQHSKHTSGDAAGTGVQNSVNDRHHQNHPHPNVARSRRNSSHDFDRGVHHQDVYARQGRTGHDTTASSSMAYPSAVNAGRAGDKGLIKDSDATDGRSRLNSTATAGSDAADTRQLPHPRQLARSATVGVGASTVSRPGSSIKASNVISDAHEMRALLQHVEMLNEQIRGSRAAARG